MIGSDRLDELETLLPDDMPDDARLSVPARDLRDLVLLIPVARAALRAVIALEVIQELAEKP